MNKPLWQKCRICLNHHTTPTVSKGLCFRCKCRLGDGIGAAGLLVACVLFVATTCRAQDEFTASGHNITLYRNGVAMRKADSPGVDAFGLGGVRLSITNVPSVDIRLAQEDLQLAMEYRLEGMRIRKETYGAVALFSFIGLCVLNGIYCAGRRSGIRMAEEVIYEALEEEDDEVEGKKLEDPPV